MIIISSSLTNGNFITFHQISILSDKDYSCDGLFKICLLLFQNSEFKKENDALTSSHRTEVGKYIKKV